MKKMAICVALIACTLKPFEYPHQEYIYRHATCKDVLFLLEVTNAIERSKAQNYIAVYPYALRERMLHEAINKQSLFIAVDPDDQTVSMATLELLHAEKTARILNATSLQDWHRHFDLNDVFLYSDSWYTEPVLRKRGTCSKLLMYALRASIERIQQYMREHNSTHIYLLVSMVEDASNHDLVQHLTNMLKERFADFIETFRKESHMDTTHAIAYTMITANTTKPFYDLEADDLHIIKQQPAQQYILEAQVIQ